MMFWNNLHKAICTTLKKEIPVIQTCDVYPAVQKGIIAPAVFIELANLDPGQDPGTEELALRARFEARIVIDSTIEDAAIIVRSLAAEVARVINRNTWGMNVSPAEFLSGEVDRFKPELEAYLVWLIEWVHEIHIGKSIWEEDKIKPHIVNVGENVGTQL
jgi:hypothetical protein